MSPKPYTHRDAVAYRPLDWTGIHPPAFPKGGVPNHVAIVMDGNGRWANRQGLPRTAGHEAGEAALLDVVAGALEIGVTHLSAYAFSTENWKRSPDEVRFLMNFNREVIPERRMHAKGSGAWGTFTVTRAIRWTPVVVGVLYLFAAVLQLPESARLGTDSLRIVLTLPDRLGGGSSVLAALMEAGIAASFLIAVVLAGIAILFGARRPDLTEHNRGLIQAIALESIVKLAALVAVPCWFACRWFGGVKRRSSQWWMKYL